MRERSAAAAGAASVAEEEKGKNEIMMLTMMAPEDFRCPISLEVMRDPVILCSGQSYDRPSIQRWLDAGHRTCPKTKQKLCTEGDVKLIPNYALRSLIHQWAHAHRVDLLSSSFSSSSSSSTSSFLQQQQQEQERWRIEKLVKDLSSGSLEVKREGAREMKMVTLKPNKHTRALIAECGVIAQLLHLLECAKDAQIEENVIIVLLSLATDDDDKVGLVAEGAVDALVHAIEKGSSIEARGTAAKAIASLAMVDVNKATIGNRSDALPALVKLLSSTIPRARKDATVALYSLCMLPDNRSRTVIAGAIPLILFGQQPAGHVVGALDDTSMALLDALSACTEGKAEIRRWASAVIPALVELLGNGSERSKESSAAVLCWVCSGSKTCSAMALEAGAVDILESLIPSLSSQSNKRARRKASLLLQILQTK